MWHQIVWMSGVIMRMIKLNILSYTRGYILKSGVLWECCQKLLEQGNPVNNVADLLPRCLEFFPFSKKDSRSKLKILTLMPVVIHTRASLPTRTGIVKGKTSEGNHREFIYISTEGRPYSLEYYSNCLSRAENNKNLLKKLQRVCGTIRKIHIFFLTERYIIL